MGANLFKGFLPLSTKEVFVMEVKCVLFSIFLFFYLFQSVIRIKIYKVKTSG